MAQGPTGGEKDVTPPEYRRSTPLPNAVSYDKNKIEIEFDEYIQLDNPTKNLIVSPTQEIFPIAKGIGKKVLVELKDSMLDNTTYTFDFGSSIVDNNERNPVVDFVFSFATGPTIDTLMISGTVLNAENLAPVPDIYVGVYTDLEDSVFISRKMERITKTNAKGNFTIRNLAEKPYRVYALADLNNNYFFDQKSEGIAVLGENVIPQIEIKTKQDTIRKDSIAGDSIVIREVARYFPDSLLLRFFKEEDKRQYFIKAERPEATKFTLYFKNPAKQLPAITPLNFEGDNWFISEPSVTRDTLLYWIKDSLIFKQDTLRFAIDYEKTDSLDNLIPAKDTIEVLYKPKELSRREKKNEKDKINFAKTLALPGVVEIYNKPVIEWEKPLQSFGKEHLSLTIKKDTLWNDLDFSIEQDTLRNSRTYSIIAHFEPEKEYRLQIDSALVTDIYGNHNDEIDTKFRIRPKDEYSNLSMHLKNAPEKAFLQLLDKNDVSVMQVPVTGEKAVFRHVKPGEYFLRLINDRNENGRWDTGNFREGIDPEEVFYYDKVIKLRVNWDVDEDWDVTGVPLLRQRAEGMAAPKKGR
jgi:uncharacterized protein (DUF2141 family)